MNFIQTLAIAMGASWVSGISLYAAVATLGLLSRFAHLELPGELQVLTSWWVIGVAVALYVVEFVADKIPVVDSAWDVIHTFIRIPAGAVLAATAFGDFDKTVQVIAFLVGRRAGVEFSWDQGSDQSNRQHQSGTGFKHRRQPVGRCSRHRFDITGGVPTRFVVSCGGGRIGGLGVGPASSH